jgi:hypothetical protein
MVLQVRKYSEWSGSGLEPFPSWYKILMISRNFPVYQEKNNSPHNLIFGELKCSCWSLKFCTNSEMIPWSPEMVLLSPGHWEFFSWLNTTHLLTNENFDFTLQFLDHLMTRKTTFWECHCKFCELKSSIRFWTVFEILWIYYKIFRVLRDQLDTWKLNSNLEILIYIHSKGTFYDIN